MINTCFGLYLRLQKTKNGWCSLLSDFYCEGYFDRTVILFKSSISLCECPFGFQWKIALFIIIKSQKTAATQKDLIKIDAILTSRKLK